MFWLSSSKGPQRGEHDIESYLKRLETDIEDGNREDIQDIISKLIELTYDADSTDTLHILSFISVRISSLSEVCCQELLPLLFHFLDQEDTDIMYFTISILRNMIEYPISLILLNTIYNTLHTVFSTNSFYGCRAVAHLIAPLYERYSAIISETPTPDLEPFRIISSSALKELRSIFFQLCNDDRLLVRREAAKQFSTCLHAFGLQYDSQFVQLMRTLVSDDNSVVYVVVPSFPFLFQSVHQSSLLSELISSFIKCLQSDSLRIQTEAAKHLEAIGTSIGSELFCSSLLNPILSMIKDGALFLIPHLHWIFGFIPKETFKEKVLPYLTPLINKDETYKLELITPLIVELMENDASLAQSLFDALLETQSEFVCRYLIDHLSPTFYKESILELILFQQDRLPSSWRWRESIAKAMGSLFKALQAIHSSRLNDLKLYHIHLFSDNVHAVRRACAVSITDVMDALTIDDFKNELLPSLISLYSSCGNYQIQSNLLYTFQNVLLSPLLSSNEDCTTEIQTLLIKELSNPIPNIRFITCKVIGKTFEQFTPDFQKEYILPKLKSLTRDEDTDVRFYSSLALERMAVVS